MARLGKLPHGNLPVVWGLGVFALVKIPGLAGEGDNLGAVGRIACGNPSWGGCETCANVCPVKI